VNANATIEQLLMLPARPGGDRDRQDRAALAMCGSWFVICMLLIKFAFGVAISMAAFAVHLGTALCLLCGIGVGTTIASFSKIGKAVDATRIFRKSAAVLDCSDH